ncbi:MAG: citrate synthase [Breznakia sp.]
MKKSMQDFFQKTKILGHIEADLYAKHKVKNGLRNEDGTGVLVALTKISDVIGYTYQNNEKKDIDGKLQYRGIDVEEIISKADSNRVNIFEEVCFLIMFGYLPTAKEFQIFEEMLHEQYMLSPQFYQNQTCKTPPKNLMNKLQQDILSLYDYDETPDDITLEHCLSKGMAIVAKMPSLIAYNYAVKQNSVDHKHAFSKTMDTSLSLAEHILSLLRPDKGYTHQEAKVLDIALVLHADHGGGNNSTFVNVVMSSSGTDLYASFAGAIGSLKGAKHGGANVKVVEMMHAVIDKIGYSENEAVIANIIQKILDKQFYDNSGLLYGMGHAVYTKSDPRSKQLAKVAKVLAKEKGLTKEFAFYERFEQLASDALYAHLGKRVSANIDFYSGFVYQMLGIPNALFTLVFACSRSVGWLAHNLEQKMYSRKIVRPATKYVGELQPYIEMEKRGKK